MFAATMKIYLPPHPSRSHEPFDRPYAPYSSPVIIYRHLMPVWVDNALAGLFLLSILAGLLLACQPAPEPCYSCAEFVQYEASGSLPPPSPLTSNYRVCGPAEKLEAERVKITYPSPTLKKTTQAVCH